MVDLTQKSNGKVNLVQILWRFCYGYSSKQNSELSLYPRILEWRQSKYWTSLPKTFPRTSTTFGCRCGPDSRPGHVRVIPSANQVPQFSRSYHSGGKIRQVPWKWTSRGAPLKVRFCDESGCGFSVLFCEKTLKRWKQQRKQGQEGHTRDGNI